jgi:ribosomal protein S1
LEIEAEVIGKDFENKRVNLSIKRLTPDPFGKVMEKFSPDKKVSGEVTRISAGGIIIDLGDSVEGIIKKDKIPPNSKYEVGQEISAEVLEVDKNRHRVILVPVLLEKPMGYR